MPASPPRAPDPLRLAVIGGALAAAVWAVWLLWLARWGCWGAGPSATCDRVDFAGFWGAGRVAVAGRAADAYAWPQVAEALRRVFGVTGLRPLAFLYPPPVLLAAAAAAAAPYGSAFAGWTGLGLLAYAAATAALLRRPAGVLVAMAPAGVFCCAYVGQNGFLTAAALAGGLLLLDRRPAAAGALLALFACKPQLALLVPVALLAGGRWRALASAGVVYAALWAASALAFGPEVILAFAKSWTGGGQVFAGGGWVPWSRVQSLYGALRGAGVDAPAALAAQGAAALAAAAATAWTWRGPAPLALKAAVLAAAALTASPYAFVYDGPLLAVAALFILRDMRSDAPPTAAEAALLLAGLFGQNAFLITPAPLVTTTAALALLTAARLRAARVEARVRSGSSPAAVAGWAERA